MVQKEIIYEQPLNELVRVSLRLEHLFSQLNICLSAKDFDQHIQTVVRLMIDVLNILDRPDLKSKFSKQFSRFTTIFSKLETAPDVSHEKLSETLKQLKQLSSHFLNTPGKIAQALRDKEFLINLRQNFMSPGGDSSIDAPCYYYWLNQSADVHQKRIQQWLKAFDEIQAAVELLLNIVRNSSEPRKIVAEKGFYHESLDPQIPCQLIRVALPKSAKIYPEISAGRHRMSIRFVMPDLDRRPRQTPEDVKFKLTLCII